MQSTDRIEDTGAQVICLLQDTIFIALYGLFLWLIQEI